MESMSPVLTFRGPLPPIQRDNKRKKEKQIIRRALHKQLVHVLKKPYNRLFEGAELYRTHEVNGFNLHPLICRHSFYPRRGCELKIEMLSNDPFGAVYCNGDIDNRLKTLFDALCLPTKHQLPPDQPLENEDPFWVLLSDDRLITDLHIVQNTLHEPNPDPTYVELTITVKIKDGYAA